MSHGTQSHFLILFAILITAITVLCFFFPSGGDYDIWWHLKYGEHYVLNLTTTIDHSQFSWTDASSDWSYGTWLGSSILYIVHQLGGFYGLFFLHCTLMVLIFICLLYFVHSLGHSIDIPLITASCLTGIVSTNPFFKPETFSILFFALTVFIYLLSRVKSSNILLYYPLLFVVWVNIHGAFIFGLFFIMTSAGMELIEAIRCQSFTSSLPRLRVLSITLVLSGIALLCNPEGGHYLMALFQNLFINTYSEHFNYIRAYQSIWNTLFITDAVSRASISAWYIIIMFLLSLILFAADHKFNKRIDIALFVANLLFFLLSMHYARMSFYYPVAWIFIASYLYLEVNSLIPKQTIQKASVALLLVISFQHINITLSYSDEIRFAGHRYEETAPFKETDFIRSSHLPTPILNDYLTGGFLIWRLHPEYKVFIDPRIGPYSPAVIRDWFTFSRTPSPEGLKQLSQKYRFNTVIFRHNYQLLAVFLQINEWTPVYFDTVAIVLVRNNHLHTIQRADIHSLPNANQFSTVDNPNTLFHLFNIYMIFNSTADMGSIIATYKNNVPNSYALKHQLLYTLEQNYLKLATKQPPK